ncbi:hypothetical protein [Nocardia wallacei]|uniref:hypothetical protein n=1 Tax=Nocardia wallacei TaxID=480035 RepID=UPI0024582FF5|nr:hypothetical protein [Nocardia wallacei]
MTSEVIAKANHPGGAAVRSTPLDRMRVWVAVSLAALPTAAVLTVLLYGLGLAMGLSVAAVIPVLWLLCCLAWGAMYFRGAQRRWPAARFGLRPPAYAEQAGVGAAWDTVARQAGAPAAAYSLWVRDADRRDPPPDRVIAITTESLAHSTPREVEAVLARELGARVHGRAAFARFVFRRYNAPVVLGERALLSGLVGIGETLAQRVPVRGARVFTGVWNAASRLLVACPIVAMATVIVGLPAALLLRLLPELASLALAPLVRRTVYRADATAADLGYGPDLCAVLSRRLPEHRARESDPLSLSATVLGPTADERIGRVRDRLDELARLTRT